jgi:dihydropteroate synthase
MSPDVYLRPTGIVSGAAAGRAVAEGVARWLAGGPLAFTAAALIRRREDGGRDVTTLGIHELQSCRSRGADAGESAAIERRLDSIAKRREAIAGVSLDRPRIMGVVNVTPDSFSDGGSFLDSRAAIAHGESLLKAGADILDVGGESTRPGAAPVPIEEELNRVLPVISALANGGAVISIDTRHAAVMRRAVDAGARIINDVTALSGDPQSLAAAAESGAAVALMHMQGEPRTMQSDPHYRDAPLDVYDFFAGRLAACEAAGIPRERILIDPGIGFGKKDPHNLALLADLALLHGLGCGLLLGVSRKSFIGRLSRGEDAAHRLPGTLAATLAGLDRGAQVHRLHDVAEAAQALALWRAISDGADDGTAAAT